MKADTRNKNKITSTALYQQKLPPDQLNEFMPLSFKPHKCSPSVSEQGIACFSRTPSMEGQPSTYMRFENAVSQLPLGPASFIASTRLDFRACKLACEGGTLVVPAPDCCKFCGTGRIS